MIDPKQGQTQSKMQKTIVPAGRISQNQLETLKCPKQKIKGQMFLRDSQPGTTHQIAKQGVSNMCSKTTEQPKIAMTDAGDDREN